jgi:hypothetical protein
MAEMKAALLNRPLSVFALLLAGVLVIACQWLFGATSTPVPVEEGEPSAVSVTLPVEQGVPAAEPTVPEADPLDHLLMMRSVRIKLDSLRPDGTRRVIDLEIDGQGNMHLKYELPCLDPETMPEGFDPNFLPNSDELYVLGGEVYRPDAQNPAWRTTPLSDEYLQRISMQFHGADSPALWLDVLPEGSIQAAGNETVGGFAAEKYTVHGMLEEQVITGTLWFEPQADALIQAELHIPAALISTPDRPQSGELTITLNTEKADVSPVTLPSP